MLDNHIKDLVSQADRHRNYKTDGEDGDILIDRALQLKTNVQKGDKIEILLTNFSNLTLLLEMFNLEGIGGRNIFLSGNFL